MSEEINVISRTQTIVVDPASSAVSVISSGPPGPPGPGQTIWVAPTPPPSPSIGDLWVDTT